MGGRRWVSNGVLGSAELIDVIRLRIAALGESSIPELRRSLQPTGRRLLDVG